MFEWTPDMQIDNGLIDEDHKQLFIIANRVFEIDHPNKDVEDLKLAIRELYDYVQYHFGTRRKLYARIGLSKPRGTSQKAQGHHP